MFKPILFNTEMVKAIQMGRKTQTRRIVKNQDGIHPRRSNIGFFGWDDGHGYQMMPPCKEGDILWVRETWQHVYNFDDGDQLIEGTGRYVYCADNPMPFDYWVDTDTGEHKEQMPWKPSIHMPKEAARIFLRVKDVRVERLQDITEEQAEKEGCSAGRFPAYGQSDGFFEAPEEWDAVEDFQRVWNETIKPDDYDVHGWNANPWVWVIEFERIEKPEDWK